MKRIGRQLAVAILLGAFVLVGAPAVAAAKVKPKAPPSPKNRATLGTRQLSGENAQLGVTYTLGKVNPINITLDSVEYTLEPVLFGTVAIWPKKTEKTMVLHYTLHNPNPRNFGLAWSTLGIDAVDANDTNWRFVQDVAIEATHAKCNMSLKPGQKTKVYTAILVPATGEIPKLMFQSVDKLVLRYNLKGKVAKLPAEIADPNDPSGATAPESIPAQMGTFYPMRGLHAKIDSVAFSTSAVKGRSPKAGGRYLVIIGTAQNMLPTSTRFVWNTLARKLIDTDGGEIRRNDDAYYASRDDTISADLAQNQEIRFRYVYEVPGNVQPRTLSLSQGDGHAYVYDLSQVQ